MGKKKRGGVMRADHGWGDDYSEYYGEAYKGGTYKAKKGWDTGDAPKVCENCDWLPKTQKQQIFIDYTVWKAIMGICAKVKVEWQALLTGEIIDGIVHVHGYLIPKQEVTGSSVKNLDLIDDVVIAERHIVAGVHSHGNMECFFSSTDMEDTNMSLIKHNIVVNNRAHYKAQTRVELPCGLVKFIEGEVSTIGEPVTDIVGLENISEPKFGFQTVEHQRPSYEMWSGREKEIKGGLRWCPVCQGTPEEDSGVSCVCWTKGERPMLPDFTLDNYDLEYGRSYKLKIELVSKYINGTKQK